MTDLLLKDDVPGYFHWLADQCVTEPLALARTHYKIAVELATFRRAELNHRSQVDECASAATAILDLLNTIDTTVINDSSADSTGFLVAADEVSAHLAHLIANRPTFPALQLKPLIRQIHGAISKTTFFDVLPSPPSPDELAQLRALLKTSPVDEPMSSANWQWLRTQEPSF